MSKTSDQIEQELIEEIEKCREIYDGLKDNLAYQNLVKDFQRAADEIDAVWHLQPDMNKLNEFRITKFAANTLIHALDGYKHSMDKARQQLETLKDVEG